MRKFLKLTIIGLAFFANSTYAAETSIKIEATKTLGILSAIVDKKLATDEGYILLSAGGKISGQMAGDLVSGEWSTKDEYYCRSIKYGDKRIDTDCQIILNSDQGVIFHRHRGGGRKVGPYRVMSN